MTERQPNLLKESTPGPRLAILVESLFLANLMIIPVLGFLAIAWLWFTKRDAATELERNHLDQVFITSIKGGTILVGLSVAIFVLGGFSNPWSWVIGVLYFTCFHATLILFGVIGLNRAILAQPYRYPVLGPPLERKP
jgi:hypothetical protein